MIASGRVCLRQAQHPPGFLHQRLDRGKARTLLQHPQPPLLQGHVVIGRHRIEAGHLASPASSSRRHRWNPMNPADPVTSALRAMPSSQPVTLPIAATGLRQSCFSSVRYPGGAGAGPRSAVRLRTAPADRAAMSSSGSRPAIRSATIRAVTGASVSADVAVADRHGSPRPRRATGRSPAGCRASTGGSPSSRGPVRPGRERSPARPRPAARCGAARAGAVSPPSSTVPATRSRPAIGQR